MLNEQLSQVVRRWVYRVKPSGNSAPRLRRAPLRLEEVEARLAPATLPPVLVETGSTRILTPTTPANATNFDAAGVQAAINPANPNKMVLATADGTTVRAMYTTDGGVNWFQFYTNSRQEIAGGGRVIDNEITTQGTPQVNRVFTNSSSPSVAIGRDGSVYLVELQHKADKSHGAVVLHKFDFTGNIPQVINLGVGSGGVNNTGKILYRWTGMDGAANPVVAIDNNVPSFTDGIETWTDTMVGKAVYVAWNTIANPVSPDLALNGFDEFGNPANLVNNPNAIVAVASGDGGINFSNLVKVSDDGYLPISTRALRGSASPRVVFSPGNGTAANPGGQLAFVWNQIADNKQQGVLVTDVSRPDGGNANQPAATVQETRGGTGGIADAIQGDTAVIPVATDFSVNINLNAATFGQVTDLDVALSLRHPNLNSISIQLIAPNNLGTVTLLARRPDNYMTPPGTIPPGMNGGNNLGYLNGANLDSGASLVFTDQAPRSINDPTNTLFPNQGEQPTVTQSLLGEYRPDTINAQNAFFEQLRSLFQGRTINQLNGVWTLRVTDFVVGPTGDNQPFPPPAVQAWSLKFTGNVDTDVGSPFGADTAIAGTQPSSIAGTKFLAYVAVPGGADNINPMNKSLVPAVGVGPGVSVAYDTSVGAGSPFAGRMYVVYTGAAKTRTGQVDINGQKANRDEANPSVFQFDTDIFLQFSDDNGVTWSNTIRVNDDYPEDNQTEGRRAQFMPTVTVDPLTGTVGVMWFDARNDGAEQRVATYVATSLDGGNSFSPRQAGGTFLNTSASFGEASTQTFLNRPRVAVDAINQNVVVLEPTPTNLQNADDPNNKNDVINAVGTRQSLLFWGGRMVPLWTGNENKAGTSLFTATVRTAAGPRVIESDMGPVTTTHPNPLVQSVLGTNVNGTLADGTRRLDGFRIAFDRPILLSSFTAGDILVQYRSPTGTTALVPVSQIVRLNGNTVAASEFFVAFTTPQTRVGTYSYRVGSNVTDGVYNPLLGVAGDGNRMDQNANAIAGEAADVYATPRPLLDDQQQFQGPYANGTLPLILPGPHLVASAPTGQTATITNVAINPDTIFQGRVLNVTFDREVKPESFLKLLADGKVSVTGPNGVLVPINLAGVDINGNTVGSPTRLFQLLFSAALPAGTYTVNLVDPVVPDNIFLNAGATGIDLTFDVPLAPDSKSVANKTLVFDSTDVIRLIGPTGDANSSLFANDPNGNPFIVIPLAADGSGGVQSGPGFEPTRYFRVQFPARTVSGPYTLEIGPAMATPSTAANNPSTGLDTSLNAGLDRLRGGATIGGPISTSTYTTKTAALASATSAAATALTLSSVEPFASAALPLTIQIDNEQMTVTAVNAATNALTVVRGVNGTAAAAHNFNAPVQVIIPTSNAGGGLTFLDTAQLSNGGITTTDTVLRLPPGGAIGFPATTPFTIRVDNEYMTVTAVNAAGANTFTVTRGAFGTTPAPHAAGALVTEVTDTTWMALDIPDEFTIRQDLINNPNARITITPNLIAGRISDLVGTLIAPDGTRIVLFTQVGSSTASGVQFGPTLDDAIGSPIQSATGTNFVGGFRPQLPLSLLLKHGAKGKWFLEITNVGTIGGGRVNGYTLTLPRNVPATGLSEAGADQFQVGFRVHIQDPTNPVSQAQWTPIGAATASTLDNTTEDPLQAAVPNNAGRANAVAVDPSDATGNTVYVGGASGGVWKTTNFLNPAGPIWTALTDFGPSAGMPISSIVVIPRNNDPNQSIVFALTGEGNPVAARPEGSAGNGSGAGVLRTGIGLLRSMDGGRTWTVHDSADNDDAAGNILPMNVRGTGANQRNGIFFGTNGYKVVYDPTPQANGQYYIYMALTGADAAAGIWRSADTGRTWTRIQAGQATDVVLAAGSAATNQQLQVLYGAFQDGVYKTTNATTVPFGGMARLVGGGGNASLQDAQIVGRPVAVANGQAPVGGAGNTITLAVPTVANSPLENLFYQNWLYAMETNATGLVGLWQTKDGGANWTRIRLPGYFDPRNDNSDIIVDGIRFSIAYGSNDDTNEELTNWTSNLTNGIAIDPNNPNIVYLSGRYVVRVDTTRVVGPQTFTFFDNSSKTQTGVITTTLGSIQHHADINPDLSKFQGSVFVSVPRSNTSGLYGGLSVFIGTQQYQFGQLIPTGGMGGNSGGVTVDPTQFLNLLRDPGNPFSSNSILFLSNAESFRNTGENAEMSSYMTAALDGMDTVYSMVSYVDPLTGKARLIFGTAQGVTTGVDRGDGMIETGIGFADSTRFSRNGNLQLGQFYAGAAQPSQTAADIAGAMFYGMSERNGFQVSSSGVIQTGNPSYSVGGDPFFSVLGVPPNGGGEVFYTPDTGTQVGTSAGAGIAYPTPNAAVARGTGTGAAPDPTGSGTAYQFRLPLQTDSDNASGLAFFRQFTGGQAPWAAGTTQTLFLDQTASGGAPNTDQWAARGVAVGAFAVNPFNPNALLIGSGEGRVYESVNQGFTWQLKSDPILTNNIPDTAQGIRSVAFGAPDPTNPTVTDNFLYAGTLSGEVYLTRTGGGQWTRIFNGAAQGDGSPVMKIDANPRPGSTDLFVVTQRGVYYVTYTVTPPSFPGGPETVGGIQVTRITGDLFSIRENVIFGSDASGGSFTNGGSASQLFALQANSLTSIAVDWRYEGTATGPIVYASGDGGVFKTSSVAAALAGGTAAWAVFPSAAEGARVDGGFLPNALVTDLDLSVGNFTYDRNTGTATTDYSNGYNILLATTHGRGQFVIRVDTNDLSIQSGPKVIALENPNADVAQPGDQSANRIRVNFDGPVDQVTFGAADVQLFFTPVGKTAEQAVAVTKVQLVSVTDPLGQNPRNQYDVFFTPPAANETANQGTYRIVVGASVGTDNKIAVSDLAGNRMNQNGNAVNGEPVVDAFTGTIFLNGPATTLLVTAPTSPAVAGEAYTINVTATRFDPNAGPVGVNGPIGGSVTDTEFVGLVALSAGDPNAVIRDVNGNELSKVSGSYVYQFQSADKGATKFAVEYQKAQTWTFVAQDPTTPDTNDKFSAGQLAVTVVGGTAVRFGVDVNTNPVVAGVANTVTVTGFDRFDNQATTYTGKVTFALSGVADKGATLPANYTFTAADAGKRTFANALTLTKAGQQILNVADTADGTVFGAVSIQVQGGAASAISISGPASTVAGNKATVTVSAVDKFGNAADSANLPLAFTSSDGQAELPSGAVLTGATGNFQVILKTVGSGTQTVGVSAAGVTAGGPVTIQVSPSPVAGSFTLSGHPSSITAGVAGAFQVAVFDPFGNAATTYQGTVAFSSTDQQAGLPANYTFTLGDAGKHTFQATLKTAGTQSLTVRDAGNPAATGSQSGITVTPSPIAGGAIVTPLQPTAAAGTPVSFRVSFVDAFGNTAPNFTGGVTFASSDPTATLPGTYTFTAADGGTKVFQATFAKAGPQTLSVATVVDPTRGGTSAPVNITPAAAASFAVAGFPASSPAGTPGSFTVTAFDQFGNVATGYTGTVAFSTTDTRATLPASVGLTNGVGTFQATLRSPGTHSLTAADAANPAIAGSQTGIAVTATAATRPPVIAVGSGPGILNTATLYNPDLSVATQFNPFEQGFTGGVRVAVAQTPDANAPRIVVAPGPGQQPDVRVYDKAAQRVLSFLPFELAFTGGVFIATGDLDRDGFDDYFATPDEGGGGRVVVVNGKTGAVMSSFFGIEDTKFRGGARVATGDVNGDGYTDLIVSAGFGGGPRVAIFDGKSVLEGNPTRLTPDFFAFEPGLRNGVYVGAGDINGDGKAELFLGAGPGGGPRVLVLDAATALASGGFGNALLANQGIIANFFAGNIDNRGGVRVTGSNLDGDDFADLVVGDGEGAGSRITGYAGNTLRTGNTTSAFELDTIPGFKGGVFVG